MFRTLVLIAGVAGLLTSAGTAQAGHHLWDITELFTDAHGSAQFVEMIGNADNEQGLGPFTLTSDGNTFNFVTNLPSNLTNGAWCLIATAAFAALPGAPTPDYTIPSNFLNPNGGTVNYASGADVVVHGALPTDGLTSVDDVGATALNSPTNFAGTAGSVSAAISTPVNALPRIGLVLLLGASLFLVLRERNRVGVSGK